MKLIARALIDSPIYRKYCVVLQVMKKAAIRIQAFGRGIISCYRVANKRLLDRSALNAFEVVDTRSLFIGDVKVKFKYIAGFYFIPISSYSVLFHLVTLSIFSMFVSMI
jgi:hypothetical protein